MTDPILYVGDSLDIKQIINESNKKIDAVQNGMIALNALSDSANKYSAIIIEDQLPLMDPSNLIKQLEHYSKTPIIAIVRSDKRRSEILKDFENGLSGWFEPKGSSVEHFNDLLDSCNTFINFSRKLNKNHRLQNMQIIIKPTKKIKNNYSWKELSKSFEDFSCKLKP